MTFTYTPEGQQSSLTEAEQRTTFWTYTPGGKIHTKTKPDGTVLTYRYTEAGDLAQVGSREFQYDALGRCIGGTGFARTYDRFGNVVQEQIGDLTVQTAYDLSDRPTRRILPDKSQILYEYTGPFLAKISRISSVGDLLYTHTYDQFDLSGRVLSETGLFTTSYQYDLAGRRTAQRTPYFSEDLAYDATGNLLQKGAHSYAYDAADQLIYSSEQGSLTYDKHYNRIAKNNDWFNIDALHQIEEYSYDLNGNLVPSQALHSTNSISLSK